MKSKFVFILMSCFLPMFLSATETANSEDKIPYDMHGEHDKTDIFAIQLDSSEEEQDEEEEELEDLQKYEQSKKV